MSFEVFLSIFSSDGHFVQPSGTILEILVKGHKGNTSMKLLRNQDTGCGDDFLKFFFFSIFSSGRHFVQPSRTILAIGKHLCVNILKSGQWPRTRCRLKIFYF